MRKGHILYMRILCKTSPRVKSQSVKGILSLHLVGNIGVLSRWKAEAELVLVCAVWLEPVTDSNSGVFQYLYNSLRNTIVQKMDWVAPRLDFRSAFAAAFLVILARKGIAIIMWKFNTLIETRLRTRKFSKARICFLVRKNFLLNWEFPILFCRYLW